MKEENVTSFTGNHESTGCVRHFLVGTVLVSINILCGIALIDAWPFAVYPTFAGVEEKYLQSLTIVLTNPDNSSAEINPYQRSPDFKTHFIPRG